jgi:hypothetical protein
MKINVCDQCLAKGKLTVSTYIRSIKHPVNGTIKMHVCDSCAKDKTPLTREQMHDILEKAFGYQFAAK